MKKYNLLLFLFLLNGCGETDNAPPVTALLETNQTIKEEHNDTIEMVDNNASELDLNSEENISHEDNNLTITNSLEIEPSLENNDTDEDIEIIETNINNEDNNLTIINSVENNDTKENNVTVDSNKSIEEPYFYQQWYLEKNEAFYNQNSIDENASVHFGSNHKYSGKGVKIAIIDDGLDTTHIELNGSIVATYDISTKTTNVSHRSMNEYHGTAVTGVIASNANGIGIIGIASESQIIFLKHKEGMSDSETIELFNKAKELGADIINCSWGTYDVSDSVKEVIQDLSINGRDGKGIVIVFATGNDGQDMGNDESSIPEVIAVGSSDKENLRAWYSNYGENIDILAPGGNLDLGITTLDDMGENGIATLDNNYLLANDENSFVGTSASAPIVSGIIALMLEKNPNLTRVEIENILHNKSDKIGNLDYVDGFNKYYGYGKINVERLLE